MSLRRALVLVPVRLALGLTCAMGIMLLTGCPQPQVPDQPDEQIDNQDDQADNDVTPEDPGRPIPQPDIPDESDGQDGGDGSSVDGDGGDGGDGGDVDDGGSGDTPVGTYRIRFNTPLNAFAVRPGTPVDITFRLTDPEGIVTTAELVLARDNDQDGEPDADPIWSTYINAEDGLNSLTFDTLNAAPLIAGTNNFGRFVIGIRATTTANEKGTTYAGGTMTLDAIAPAASWVAPDDNKLMNPAALSLSLQTSDNSPHTIEILLDEDTNPDNGFAGVLLPETTLPAGAGQRNFNPVVAISPGTYYYRVIVSDGIAPATAFYAPNLTVGNNTLARLAVTGRLIGTFDLNQLSNSTNGAIVQGFNFNDLCGSAMVSVPDLDGDEASELIIASRFGKSNLVNYQGQGWGEASLIYGNQGARLSGVNVINSVGDSIPGLTFRGIRVPMNTSYTAGLADIDVVDDMDGDELPELVFSFPRVESLTLNAPAFVGTTPFQHPDLVADIGGMGIMEYDAIDYMGGTWVSNMAQFCRGGIVIVSSHNRMLSDRDLVTRKFDRVLDLHEVGQMFDFMVRPTLTEYIRKVTDITPDPPDNCADCIAGVMVPDNPCEGDPPPDDCCDDCSDPACPCSCEPSDACADCGGVLNNENETAFTAWDVAWDVWLGGG